MVGWFFCLVFFFCQINLEKGLFPLVNACCCGSVRLTLCVNLSFPPVFRKECRPQGFGTLPSQDSGADVPQQRPEPLHGLSANPGPIEGR